MALPWINNNQFLEDFLQDRVGGSSILRTNNAGKYYFVPVRTIIYRDDENNPLSAISTANVRTIVDELNNVFFRENTGIQFFIQFEDIIADNDFRSEINSDADVAEMFLRHNQRGVLNLHFIRNNGGNEEAGGSAVNPLKINISPKFNLYVRTHGTRSINANIQRFIPNIVNTLAHEVGHTFGLLHTHHAGRVALINQGGNADVNNNCWQEYVERTARNNQINCTETFGSLLNSNDGAKKCEVNGDFLCDTKADPKLVRDGTRFVNANCGYSYTQNGDYQVDNSGKNWDPPTRNIMSYSSPACRTNFSGHQIATMWYVLETYFRTDWDPRLRGDEIVCANSVKTYQVNIPSELGLTWTTSENISITSTGNNVINITADPNAAGETGWVQANIQFPFGNPVRALIQVQVGPPDISDMPYYIHVGQSFTLGVMEAGKWNNIHVACQTNNCQNTPEVNWEITATNSLVSHTKPNNSARIKPLQDQISVRYRSYNECGCSGWRYHNFNVVGGVESGGSPSGNDDPILEEVPGESGGGSIGENGEFIPTGGGN